jgi:hypothetical protein
MFEVFRRLMRIYLESYPQDTDSLERFLKWSHNQYGYIYDQSRSK